MATSYCDSTASSPLARRRVRRIALASSLRRLFLCFESSARLSFALCHQVYLLWQDDNLVVVLSNCLFVRATAVRTRT